MLVFRFFPHLVMIQRCEEVSVFILGKLVGFAGIQHLPGPSRVTPWSMHLHFAIPLCAEQNPSQILHGETGEHQGCRAGREHKPGWERNKKNQQSKKIGRQNQKCAAGRVGAQRWFTFGSTARFGLIFTAEERWGWESRGQEWWWKGRKHNWQKHFSCTGHTVMVFGLQKG